MMEVYGYFRPKSPPWADEQEYNIPIKIMEDCKDILESSVSYSYYFAIKNDNTLWGWGSSYNGILLNGKSKQDNSYLKEIPDSYFYSDESIKNQLCFLIM